MHSRGIVCCSTQTVSEVLSVDQTRRTTHQSVAGHGVVKDLAQHLADRFDVHARLQHITGLICDAVYCVQFCYLYLVRLVRDAEAAANVHKLKLDAQLYGLVGKFASDLISTRPHKRRHTAYLLAELDDRVKEDRDGFLPVRLVHDARPRHHVDAKARGAGFLGAAVRVHNLTKQHNG